MTFFRTATLIACLATALPLAAFAPKQEGPKALLHLEPAAIGVHAETLDPDERSAAGSAARSFVLNHGGEWSFRVDQRTSRFSMIQGSGIPLIPGRGNTLGVEALVGLTTPDGEITIESLEPRIRQFIDSNSSLLKAARGTLVLDRSSAIRDNGRLISFKFDWLVDGIPVEGAQLFVRVNSGNITQFGAPLVGPIDLETRPSVEARQALRWLLEYSGDTEVAQLQGLAELLIQPEDGADRIEHRLVWKIVYRIEGRIENWEGRVDAHTGEVVGFRDINAYARAVGGIYPRTVFDNNEISVPMISLDIAVGGTNATGDSAGFFSYSGGPVSSGLNGRYFDTSCQNCTNPAQPLVVTGGVGSGRVDFGLGGVDEAGNGFSTPADRNSHYHLTKIREVANKWLPTNPFVDQIGFTSNVNIESSCNAVYTGNAVNFFRSGGNCNNTGEVADVMYHEWGHGIDQNTNGGDGATGEATADVVSMQMTHSPLIGPGFRTSGAPVRDLDWTTNPDGLLTVSNLLNTCVCGVNQSCGPLGGEVHCEGEIYGQAGWELGLALAAKHGHHTGWRESERMFFTSLPDAEGMLPTSPQPVYDAYVNADDDNGNLADGTPNGQEIFDVFDLHEIATTPVTSSAGCVRPAQPALIVTPQCGAFDLSWSPVLGIDHYELFRTELIEDQSYFPVATVGSGMTTFFDTEVAPGIDYWYVVMAVAPGGCESTVENPVIGTLPAQPILSLVTAIDDDTPMGNRSGFADPGEDVDLKLSLGNFGQTTETLLSGSVISTTPGVSFLLDTTDFDDLSAGEIGPNLDPLRFTTDDGQIGCGDLLNFRLVPSGASGCDAETSFFDVTLGQAVVEHFDDFETDQGWQFDAANSNAESGDWVLGDPEATEYQPGNDVTPGGTQAWYTASNPNNENGIDDVDNGTVVLLSPLFDLSGVDNAEVSYYRWWGLSTPGADVGDFFIADVSDDDGQTWVNLETLGTNDPAPLWTERRFALGDFISLTDEVRFRFQATDGTGLGSVVEAAIDEFKIDRFECDATPACFDQPTFAGIESASPGGSCGENNLSWQPATSNCIDAEIGYDVYRSTTPGFTPGPLNLAIEGLAGLGFTDTLLDPGLTYYYIVRAFDSRSGQDGNLVELSAAPPSGPDTSAPLFDGLDSVTPGGTCGEIVLSWSAALESCHRPVTYDIYRSTDPGFTPGPANLVATTLVPTYVDAALSPGLDQTYVVRARDTAGNTDTNNIHITAGAGARDKTVFHTEFEPTNAGWSVVAPDDATAGNWEWGNPSGTSYQPENDATDGGVNCWITGLAPSPGNGDVDGGTTTLLSAQYDMASMVNPLVHYSRWFTNDRGGSAGDPTDDFRIDVSNNDGGSWTTLESVGAGTPLEWVEVDAALPIAATTEMRFRFSAADLGAGSLVEAGIDDFSLVDVGQGCTGCGFTFPTVCNLQIGRSGDDIIVDWGIDPGHRVIVYNVSGCGALVRLGTVDGGTSFVHQNAALSAEPFNYRVSSVNGCGVEFPFCGSNDCP